MPTSRRISSIFFKSLVSSMPSTMIWPFWCSSSRLMQRISVDLPEPEGPQMTMRSPLWTVRLMSFSTWNWPYHLWTASRLIMTSSEICIAAVAAGMGASLALVSAVKFAFQVLAVARHAETESEIYDRDEGECGVDRSEPVRVAGRGLRHAQQLDLADDQHQCRIHEQADEAVDDARDRNAQ